MHLLRKLKKDKRIKIYKDLSAPYIYIYVGNIIVSKRK